MFKWIIKSIKNDYEKWLYYREDSLKAWIYYHIRKEIEDTEKNIYTEYNLKDIGSEKYFSDIVITDGVKDNNWSIPVIKEIFEIKFSYSSLKRPLGEDLQKIIEISEQEIKINFFMIYESKREIDVIIENIKNILLENKQVIKDNIKIYFLISKLNKEMEKDEIYLYEYINWELTEII